MKTNFVIDISPPILYLVKFWFLSYGPDCCGPIKLENSLKCNISKKVNGEIHFWHADKCFLQGDTLILGVRCQAYSKYPK